jgi:hypothetical protein
MPLTLRAFNIDEVLWQEDVALFRSMDGRIPWAERLGQGRVKVLHYDLKTQAGSYLFEWPAGYDAFGEHQHGGNCSELVLAGSLVEDGRTWGPGSFFQAGAGESHGAFAAGPEGCTFLLHVDGPFFDQRFLDSWLEEGKASRHR